jgi:hypothetical protein
MPKAIAREAARHHCKFPDAEILLEDVRQSRQRRWWLTTVVALFIISSLGGLGVWIYSVGESVGRARSEMQYMQRSSDSDRLNIGRNSDSVRTMERENATRYSEIQTSLIRLDARLENIEKAMTKTRRRR